MPRLHMLHVALLAVVALLSGVGGCLPDVQAPDLGEGEGEGDGEGDGEGEGEGEGEGVGEGEGEGEGERRLAIMDPDGLGLVHVNLDGGDRTTLVSDGLDSARGLGSDPISGELYWGIRTNPGFIRRIGIAGGPVDNVVNSIPQPDEVRLAPQVDLIFWHRTLNGNLQGIGIANFDGSGAEEIIESTAISTEDDDFSPGAFVIDEAAGTLYWAREYVFFDNATLMAADLDGTNHRELVEIPEGINSLVLYDDVLYFTTEQPGSIERINVDGTGRSTVAAITGTEDLAFDEVSERFFVVASDAEGRSIVRVDLDGSNQVTLFSGAQTSFPVGLAVTYR